MNIFTILPGQIDDYITAGVMTAFGLFTIVISQIIGISQIWTTMKTKNTSGTSIWTYIIFIIMSFISLTWGMFFYFQRALPRTWIIDRIPPWLHQWTIIPILVYYVGDIMFACVMIGIKARHIILAKKLKMSELELSEYLLRQQKRKYIQSGKKFYYWKHFPFIIMLVGLYIVLAIFATTFTLYTDPLIGTWPVEVPPFKPEFIMSLSLIGAFAWEAVSWPQFIKCIRNRDTSGIAMNWAIFLPISCCISFTYSILLAVWNGSDFDFSTLGGIIFNGMIVNFGILIIKLKNRKVAKTKGITELQYTEAYILPAINKKQIKQLVSEEKNIIQQTQRIEAKYHKKEPKKKRA